MASGAGERREGEGESSLVDPHIEGFESRPSSRVMKTTADTTQENLQSELRHHGTSQTPPTSYKSRDSTKATPTGSALSHLTNDILTYSSQVSRATASAGGDGEDQSGSVSQSTWLPGHRDDVLRPVSPMAVNRVFKVVFLGELYVASLQVYTVRMVVRDIQTVGSFGRLE